MDEKKCIVCGGAFHPKNKRSRFCGDLCEKKYYRERANNKKPPPEKKVCVVCGKIIDPKKTSKKYCSAECRKKYEVQYSEMLRKRKIEEMSKPRICPVCGKMFLAKVWNQEACNNPECKKELKRIKARKEMPKTKKKQKIKYGSKAFHELPFVRQWEIMTLAEASDYACKLHKSYGELQKEYYSAVEGFGKRKISGV